MQPSLGKMSAYKILNWRDQAAGTIDEIVAAFLELGEAIATRWIETRKGVLVLQTPEKFDRAFTEYNLFRLVEQPGLLLAQVQSGNA
jgi:hypothetical protein